MSNIYKITVLLMASEEGDTTYRLTCTTLGAKVVGKAYVLSEPFGLSGITRVPEHKIGKLFNVMDKGLNENTFKIGFSIWVDDENEIPRARLELVTRMLNWLKAAGKIWDKAHTAVFDGELEIVNRSLC
jgi:hypothetical protein